MDPLALGAEHRQVAGDPLAGVADPVRHHRVKLGRFVRAHRDLGSTEIDLVNAE